MLGHKEMIKMKKQIYIIGIMLLVMISFVLAEQELSNPFKQYDCIQAVQTCDNCTFVNFTSVQYPDSTFEILNIIASNYGTDFNLTFCNTSQIGTYIFRTIGDLNGEITKGNFNVYINPSGQTFNNVIYEYLFFILILVIFYFILYLGYKHEDLPIVMIVSFGIMLLGIYIFQNGIANLNNQYTNAFSLINICLAAYILLRGSVDLINKLNEEGQIW